MYGLQQSHFVKLLHKEQQVKKYLINLSSIFIQLTKINLITFLNFLWNNELYISMPVFWGCPRHITVNIKADVPVSLLTTINRAKNHSLALKSLLHSKDNEVSAYIDLNMTQSTSEDSVIVVKDRGNLPSKIER